MSNTIIMIDVAAIVDLILGAMGANSLYFRRIGLEISCMDDAFVR
jgi:hypothetical protein